MLIKSDQIVNYNRYSQAPSLFAAMVANTERVLLMSDDNARRVERLKNALGCKTDAELAVRIQSHPPNITRWKKRGFYPILANLVDALLEEIEKKVK